jgi:hypothetical protein
MTPLPEFTRSLRQMHSGDALRRDASPAPA